MTIALVLANATIGVTVTLKLTVMLVEPSSTSKRIVAEPVWTPAGRMLTLHVLVPVPAGFAGGVTVILASGIKLLFEELGVTVTAVPFACGSQTVNGI